MSHSFKQGSTPLLVSIPHNGCRIPDQIAATMTTDGRSSRDTDWFLDRLYNFPELDSASVLVAELSRYVIDLNRSKNDESLYPGQSTTGLIPEICFDGGAIYSSEKPSAAEINRRVKEIWAPYHARIETEMNRLQASFGVAVLLESHSIASQVPMLFDGTLPDFNLGTNRGKSCDPDLQNGIADALSSQHEYSHVTNGRFVGGYITRRFGHPEKNWHAIQIELSQATYMNESTRQWDAEKAATVQPVLQSIIQAITTWLPQKMN